MADENQNNQDHSSSSFKEQVLRSLRGEDIGEGHSASSENRNQNLSHDLEAENTKEQSGLSDTPDNEQLYTKKTVTPNSYAESESVGSRRVTDSSTAKKQTVPSVTEEPAKDDASKRKQKRKREDRMVSRIVILVISVLVLVMLIFGFTFYRYVNAGLKPLDVKEKGYIQVHIPEGSSNKKIANILEESKVIKSGMVFNYYAKFNNLTDFQAGYYQISPSMTLDEIGATLREGGTAEPTQMADAKLTIPEGFDIEKIGDAIQKNTELKKEQFIELMKNEAFFNTMNQKYPDLLGSAASAEGVRYRLEGYLFPATYDYYKGIKLEDFVEQMIAKTNNVMQQYIPIIHAKGMTNQQVLSLASLVEKEGVKEEDRKKIAQVFFNRIAENMPLQSDISILYAIGEHKELVTYKDLEVDSPYNLYKNTGYGPGPFCSPSEQSINAVLNPEPNNYKYFVADISTGKVYFAETYEEHNELVEKYVNKEKSE
ncbi:endolytic transglycosylase MltG [Enterococcus rivorum]|uniref:Endolytic murein transglycosylase n=1 Tax=Enterococcus rivorum TaxID=762845 RepID=A0A1E5KX44_9ENTE|nr:endolytic transglycosylase MltG [Enterococcus rivorum]MBP2097222.1 UPF0755 protein [Enterococcus rivorum]OEH82423.1 aminodeoxychorismate lyase [Enterococcus rivorum]